MTVFFWVKSRVDKIKVGMSFVAVIAKAFTKQSNTYLKVQMNSCTLGLSQYTIFALTRQKSNSGSYRSHKLDYSSYSSDCAYKSWGNKYKHGIFNNLHIKTIVPFSFIVYTTYL